MDTVLTLIQGPAGALVVLVAIVFTGMKRKWVFGWQYNDVVKDRDEWKTAALRGTHIAERVVTLHESRRRERDDSEDAS